MKRLPLNMMRYIRDSSGNPTRKYHSVNGENFNGSIDELVLEKIGSSCQDLKISHIIYKTPEFLKNIFKSFKMLKKLSLHRVQLDFDDDIELSDNELTLKKLEMVQADHRILNFLCSVQILNLEITDGHNRKDEESLVKFMLHQTKLESLTIENLSDGTSVLFNNSSNFRFKLKKLSTLFSRIPDIEKFQENFISFLRPFQYSLTQLNVEGSLSSPIYKFIVSNMSCIQQLEINVNELPQENSFYNLLSPNQSLKILKLNGTSPKTTSTVSKKFCFIIQALENCRWLTPIASWPTTCFM